MTIQQLSVLMVLKVFSRKSWAMNLHHFTWNLKCAQKQNLICCLLFWSTSQKIPSLNSNKIFVPPPLNHSWKVKINVTRKVHLLECCNVNKLSLTIVFVSLKLISKKYQKLNSSILKFKHIFQALLTWHRAHCWTCVGARIPKSVQRFIN